MLGCSKVMCWFIWLQPPFPPPQPLPTDAHPPASIGVRSTTKYHYIVLEPIVASFGKPGISSFLKPKKTFRAATDSYTGQDGLYNRHVQYGLQRPDIIPLGRQSINHTLSMEGRQSTTSSTCYSYM